MKKLVYLLLLCCNFLQGLSGTPQQTASSIYKTCIKEMLCHYSQRALLCDFASMTPIPLLTVTAVIASKRNTPNFAYIDFFKVLSCSAIAIFATRYLWLNWADRGIKNFEQDCETILNLINNSSKEECLEVLNCEFEFCRLNNYQRSKKRIFLEFFLFIIPNLKVLIGIGEKREERIVTAVAKVRNAAQNRIIELDQYRK